VAAGLLGRKKPVAVSAASSHERSLDEALVVMPVTATVGADVGPELARVGLHDGHEGKPAAVNVGSTVNGTPLK